MAAEKTPWELVLADVEADVQRSAALLLAPAAHADPGAPPAPAELMLPVGADDLPPLSQMPPVPPELLGRITELRERIVALRAELETELAASRSYTQRRSVLLTTAITAAPHFVDRRI